MKVLYLSYDGLCDPLGSAQILPYVKGLAKKGVQYTLISREKEDRFRAQGATLRDEIARLDIRWIPLPYLPARSGWKALINIWKLFSTTRNVCAEFHPDFIHCRSYIPASIARRLKIPYLFDMRGFWIDERIEGKIWPETPVYLRIYRFLKKHEPALFRDAAHIISLTRRAIPRIQTMAPGTGISVIPCIADSTHFNRNPEHREQARTLLEIKPDAEVVVYLGSLGTWYLADEMMQFFKTFLNRFPDAVFLLITPEKADTIYTLTRNHQIPQTAIRFIKAKHAEVPFFLCAADFGISFIRDLPSKAASSPTKIAEYALMSLPVIYNPVGDLDQMPVYGALIRHFNEASYNEAIHSLTEIAWDAREIRKKALDNYNMEDALNTYYQSYSTILKKISSNAV